MASARFKAVLFDVGGPIDTEVQAERYIDGQIRARLAELGIQVTDQQYADANRWAVESFAPDAYSAIAWRLAGGDASIARRVREQGFPGRTFELRPGIDRVINRLSASGLKLGLAANQPAQIIEMLDRAGIGRYFNHRQVSGHHGFHKPDVRLFLAACDDLGVTATETVMVGDRIDNDIVPANRLGMTTVLFRTGRHVNQQPRSWEECPDAEVWDVDQLMSAFARLIE